MNDENFKNQNNTFQNAQTMEDYDIEIVKKISFWTTLFYKFKNKNVKLLPSGNTKPQSTYKSITYMWLLGDLKNSLFSKFDKLKSTIIKQKEIQITNSYISNAQINTNSNINAIIVPRTVNINNKSEHYDNCQK